MVVSFELLLFLEFEIVLPSALRSWEYRFRPLKPVLNEKTNEEKKES